MGQLYGIVYLNEKGDMDEFSEKLSDFGNDEELWDQGMIITVNGKPVIGMGWDGNSTVELILEGDDD